MRGKDAVTGAFAHDGDKLHPRGDLFRAEMGIQPLQVVAHVAKEPRFRIAEHFGHHRVARGLGGHFQHQHVIGFALARLLKQRARRQRAGDQVDVIAKVFQPLHLAGDDAVDDFLDNRVFIGEIAIDLPDAELRALGDFRHAGGVEAVAAEAGFRRFDDLIAAGLHLGLFTVVGGEHLPDPLLRVSRVHIFGCERSFSIVV